MADSMRSPEEMIIDDLEARLVAETKRADEAKRLKCDAGCEQVMAERDGMEEAVQAVHVALGGDGEWSSSHDLRHESVEMASELLADRDTLRGLLLKAQAHLSPACARYEAYGDMDSMDAAEALEVEITEATRGGD